MDKMEVDDTQDDESSTPKEGWPKYLRTNLQAILKARKEREKVLAELEQVCQKNRRVFDFAVPRKQAERRRFDNRTFDVVGEHVPLRVMFMPDKFCCVYDEQTVSTCTDMVKFSSLAKLEPHQLTERQVVLLCRYLSVCRDQVVINGVFPIVETLIVKGTFVPEWKDVQDILVNMGLSANAYTFIPNTYYSIVTPKRIPVVSNFKIMFVMIEKAFREWDVAETLELLKFCVDCMFEVAMQECASDVTDLTRSVLLFLLEKGHEVDVLVDLVNQNHICFICNRHIVEQLGGDPRLSPITTKLSYMTVFDVLHFNPEGHSLSFPLMTQVLDGIIRLGMIITTTDGYQLLLIVENLLRKSAVSHEAESLAKALTRFAQHTYNQAGQLQRVYLLPVKVRLEERMPLVRFCEGNYHTSTVLDCTVTLKSSAAERLLLNKAPCICRYCIDYEPALPAASVLPEKVRKLFHFYYSSTRTPMLPHTLYNYFGEDVLLPPDILSCLITNFHILDQGTDVVVKTILQLHLSYHPPCRRGMHAYYLCVLNSTVGSGVLGKHSTDNTFVCVVQQYKSCLGSTEIPGSAIKLENMTFLFKYIVELLIQDYFVSKQQARPPIILQVVWGNSDDEGYATLNDHCRMVIKMFFDAPFACKREIGVYLTLLAGILQIEEVHEGHYFWPLGCNGVVTSIVDHLVHHIDLSLHTAVVDAIPSPLLQCQVVQGLLYQQLASVSVPPIVQDKKVITPHISVSGRLHKLGSTSAATSVSHVAARKNINGSAKRGKKVCLR